MSALISNSNSTRTRTITLTNQPPVTIKEDAWPVLAEAITEHGYRPDTGDWDRKTECSIRVRQHANGRAIVYAHYSYVTKWHGERDDTRRSGVLLWPTATTDQIVAAIRQVWKDLDVEAPGAGRIVEECIADLPAQDLT